MALSLAGLVEEINLLSFKLRAHFMIQLSTIAGPTKQAVYISSIKYMAMFNFFAFSMPKAQCFSF